jgi:hypothetical protein
MEYQFVSAGNGQWLVVDRAGNGHGRYADKDSAALEMLRLNGGVKTPARSRQMVWPDGIEVSLSDVTSIRTVADIVERF